MNMINSIAAQGDILFIRPSSLGLPESPPAGATDVQPEGNTFVLARSDKGHHHITRTAGAELYRVDDTASYLLAPEGGAEIVHLRDTDPHAPILLAPGWWVVRRQQERTPDGWRRAAD